MYTLTEKSPNKQRTYLECPRGRTAVWKKEKERKKQKKEGRKERKKKEKKHCHMSSSYLKHKPYGCLIMIMMLASTLLKFRCLVEIDRLIIAHDIDNFGTCYLEDLDRNGTPSLQAWMDTTKKR